MVDYNNSYKIYYTEEYKMNNEFQKYFQEDIGSELKLDHTGNNQLFKITTFKREYILKKYSTLQKDLWNRGMTEFKTLNNLWEIGFREIPEPLRFYEKENIGIYSFERGIILKPEEVVEKDVIGVANFLTKLHSLRTYEKQKFALERTKCLCILDYANLIKTRIKSISEDFSADENAKEFWYSIIIPRAEELIKVVLSQEKKIDLSRKLSLEEQVVTPGDFGFHNILIDKEKYIFLDFEYCGRDDPMKQLLDFVHHDKTININKELKFLFLEEYKEKRAFSDIFEKRLKIIDPLIGMNWVLVYLNPLSKNYQNHLQFSRDFNINEIIKERIIKAESKLSKLSFFES